MFSKKLMDKIEKCPKLQELDKGLGTFMLLQGYKRVKNKDGSFKIAEMTGKEKTASFFVGEENIVINNEKIQH